MSGIYGLVRFHGGVDAAQARAMRDAMGDWGTDGGMHLADDAALGALRSPEDDADAPAVLRLPGGATLVATARLDNRDELLAHFRLPHAADDRALVAAAWERWGDGACERLYGDWSFAAWQPERARLLLARDHFGNTALYHHHGASAFLFGSSRKALLALPETPRRLNELRLAQHLAFWVADGAATLHDGIARLPPGHRLVATPGAVRVERYWHPEAVPELRLRDDREYVDAFLERYDAAVRVRLRTRRAVATTLSAGLDSGSVTALAARALAPSGASMTAFTAVPHAPAVAAAFPRLLVDEWPLARRVAERYGIADHRRVTAESVGVLAALERSLALHDEPAYAVPNLPWIVALLEEARAAGVGVLLTGQFGNGTVSWSGDRQRALRALRAGRWGDVWRSVRPPGPVPPRALPRALAGRVAGQLVAPLLQQARAAAFRHGWSDGPMERWGIIAPAFARRIGLLGRVRGAGYDPFGSALLEPRAQRLRLLLPEINPFGATWHEAGAAHGLRVVDPTADVRLMELCLSIPDAQYARGAHDRWLLRRAMEGVLPPEVQWNTRRGVQGADLPFRLRAEADAVDDAVESVARAPLAGAYLDVAALRRRWARVRSGEADGAPAEAVRVARALLFGLFLERTDFRDGATHELAP